MRYMAAACLLMSAINLGFFWGIPFNMFCGIFSGLVGLVVMITHE